jgi:Nucleotidyl transferase AbiEii toxin, Type IV TA system
VAGGTPPIHRRLAEIGLRVGGPFGFALAGGHAIAAHGILQRPSEDVDLFADWQRRADFPSAVDEVITAYRAERLDVHVDLRLDTFARLLVTDPDDPDRQHRVELVANWRAQPPVQPDIGRVLHPDDVMAGKMDALCNRAAARDFLDNTGVRFASLYPSSIPPARCAAGSGAARSGEPRRLTRPGNPARVPPDPHAGVGRRGPRSPVICQCNVPRPCGRQHCLYLRREPHQHGPVRSGGQATISAVASRRSG